MTKNTQTRKMRTNTRRRIQRRPTNNHTNNEISFSLRQLEGMSMKQLKSMCRDRGVDDRAQSKHSLIGRLLPYMRDVQFDSSDTYEIAIYLKESKLSTMGSAKEKKDRLEEFLCKSQNSTREQVIIPPISSNYHKQEVDSDGLMTPVTHKKRQISIDSINYSSQQSESF